MRFLLLAVTFAFAFHNGLSVSAEDAATELPVTSASSASDLLVSEGVRPTPEMWFYLQERQRYQDPRAAVRRNAEFRAQQRQQRIATLKALGLSNSRPSVYRTVFANLYPEGQLTARPLVWPTTYVIESPAIGGQTGNP